MQEGLEKYKNKNKKAEEIYETVFGKKAKLSRVEAVVNKLSKENVYVKLATEQFDDDEIAAVTFSAPDLKSKGADKPEEVQKPEVDKPADGQGGNALDDAGRAGTLIHEASHQLAKTGDKVSRYDKILKPSTTGDENGLDGYTSNANMHKTVAEVNNDAKYTGVRDTVSNMHENAESYALFASLCSQPGALTRRDANHYNRALVEGDHEELNYLARRNSCKLPADYFAKKAAAKKAAAAKAGSSDAKAAHKPLKPSTIGSALHAVKKLRQSTASLGHVSGSKGTSVAKTTMAGKPMTKLGQVGSKLARTRKSPVQSSHKPSSIIVAKHGAGRAGKLFRKLTTKRVQGKATVAKHSSTVKPSTVRSALHDAKRLGKKSASLRHASSPRATKRTTLAKISKFGKTQTHKGHVKTKLPTRVVHSRKTTKHASKSPQARVSHKASSKVATKRGVKQPVAVKGKKH
ncbi:hypothetical protein BDN70DRAFT_993518 [Pholiota conissans]|uniref:Lysine-specific metallo-endopeptidase domain-containing protein n=1 Tax=Pholiota conissans TaxID=109636 RepID=A0A9P5Z1C0_9AGAR|nr:hypothetical protein BDN70DRAFT_993518 [Pholiota conissans]